MGWTWRTWLLLALSFLIVCTHADTDANTSATTISKSSEEPSPGATSAVDSSVSSISSRSTPAPPPAVTVKETTRAPPTAPPQTTVMPPNPQTTAKPTDPSTKASSPSAGGGATLQPSTPSAGGGAVRQPTVITDSKSTEIPKTAPPGTTAPTSRAHSTPPPPPPLPPVSVGTTVLGPAPPLTSGSPVQTSPPGSRTTVTVPQTIVNSGTTRVTNVPAPSATGSTLIHATTKQDAKDVVSTTAVVTSKSSPSPDQRLTVPSSSAPPPTVPQRLERSTSALPSVATAGGSRLDLVSVSTKESRVQTRDQTTDHTSVQTTVPFTTAVPAPRVFSYSLNKGHQSAEEKELVSLCQQLMGSLEDGNCTISFRHHNGKVLFDSAEITGKVKTTIVTQHFEDITKKPSDNRTLITILASCGALLIMIVILAVCASQHRKPYGNQMHLTEELQTVENGYHDNPTLEVMEVGVDMQEKKSPPLPGLNNGGDFNDSWIVPIDNLLKEEGPDEEDTHL